MGGKMGIYERIMNRIEILSLNVSIVTCYVGLWYLTGDIGYETSIIVFIIILLANAVFGIMWILAYLALLNGLKQ